MSRHLFEVPEEAHNCTGIVTTYLANEDKTVLFNVVNIKGPGKRVTTIAELFTAFVAELMQIKLNKEKDIYQKTLLIAAEACLAPVEDLKRLANCMLSHVDTVNSSLEDSSEREVLKEFKAMGKGGCK
jgi:hypothetical protein